MTLQKEVSLQPLNTFGLAAIASLYIEINSVTELQSTIKSDEFNNNEVLILGGGSNILLTQDFRGLVIRNGIKGIEIIRIG